MIDIISFQESVMLELAESLLSPKTAYWKPLAAAFFESVGGLTAFKSRLVNPNFFQGALCIPSPFWRAVLICWLKHVEFEHSPLTLGDPIFNNTSLSVRGNALFSSVCMRHGIIQIKDMFVNGVEITFANFQDKCSRHPRAIIDYHCICSALLKINNSTLGPPDEKLYFKGLLVGNIGRKRFYSLIKPSEVPISHAFWKRKYDVEILDINCFNVLTYNLSELCSPENVTLNKTKSQKE